ADYDVTERTQRYSIRRAGQGRIAHPRVVMCAPSGATDVEKRAINEACIAAGARQMSLIEEPLAAAIGGGLPIAEPSGSMVVDVGGGTTEVAVLSLGGIVVSESVRVGGYDLDEAIAADVRRRYNLALGQQTAEALKIELGSAWPLSEELQTEIRGRDLVSGLPRQVVLTTEEVREALEEPLAAIVAAVRTTLERTPPELAADIVQRGIMLAGGGALLKGLDERLRQETQMPVYTAENPLECVAIGAGRSLDEFEAMQRSTRLSAGRPRLRGAWLRAGRGDHPGDRGARGGRDLPRRHGARDPLGGRTGDGGRARALRGGRALRPRRIHGRPGRDEARPRSRVRTAA